MNQTVTATSSSPSFMPIYAGSVRDYKPSQTFWYITLLVAVTVPPTPIFNELFDSESPYHIELYENSTLTLH